MQFTWSPGTRYVHMVHDRHLLDGVFHARLVGLNTQAGDFSYPGVRTR
ncbi:MAG TPA: hypothetical protein PLM96_07165 [Methanoregulaceae archaeon]|nr:hypothetical protein [Methanoregulaceae archaeon]HPQ76404.1 hypothetical protein [Methanoregulaceae archaeon]